jgi:TolA-binding protein
VTLLAENDGWDWNAGVTAEWRGVTLGVYGTELEAGGRKGTAEGFNVYNYTKVNFAFGYFGNVRDISHGVVLRSRVTELTREQQRLRTEIASRERRVHKLEGQLAEARRTQLAELEKRRQQLELDLQAEREAIRRASDRLKELEQGGAKPPATKPPSETSAPKSPEGR